MIKKIGLSFVGVLVVLLAIAQEAADTAVQTEPTGQQKMILYGMTALGVVLIGLGLKNTKLFKKK
tara:strand:- start:115 stop:309 length:195 start_codon:yes stop_codon:yes gene_type:complete